MNKFKRLGFLSEEVSFVHICQEQDNKLFTQILFNKHHVLHVDIIKPVNVVRDLWVYLDSELSMKHHISTVVRACFFHLRRLKSIRRILGAGRAESDT